MIQSADSDVPLPGGAKSPSTPNVPTECLFLLSLYGLTQGGTLFSAFLLKTELGRAYISSVFRENLLTVGPIIFLSLKHTPLQRIKTCLFMWLAINKTPTYVHVAPQEDRGTCSPLRLSLFE